MVNSLDLIRKELLKRGHTPFLFAPEAKGYSEAHAGVFRFPSVDVDPKVGFPFPIPFSAKLSRLVPKMSLELIHSHHPILVGGTAAAFARRQQIPLVYTFHTQIEQYTHYVPFFNQETVKDAARNKVSRYLAKCDLIICPSSSIRELIDSYDVELTRVVTLPNAINLAAFGNVKGEKRSLRAKLNLPKQAFLSLSVGRLATEKGLPFLLRAFAKTRQDVDHHLLLAGDGPRREDLIRLVQELGLVDKVHFLGSFPYSEMPQLYAQSDLFVMCSMTEVKPLAVLEALACGLPSLAVSACGTKDTLTHDYDGRLCDLDEDQYVSHWDELLNNQSLRRRLSEGSVLTAQDYSIESYTDKLCVLYEETLEHYKGKALRCGRLGRS